MKEDGKHDIVKEDDKKTTKKRQQKEEKKKELKQAQLKIESMPKAVAVLEEVKVQSTAS